MAREEGVRRLSLFAGGLGLILWLPIAGVVIADMAPVPDPLGLGYVFLPGFIFFGVPFGLVRTISWVVSGFKK